MCRVSVSWLAHRRPPWRCRSRSTRYKAIHRTRSNSHVAVEGTSFPISCSCSAAAAKTARGHRHNDLPPPLPSTLTPSLLSSSPAAHRATTIYLPSLSPLSLSLRRRPRWTLLSLKGEISSSIFCCLAVSPLRPTALTESQSGPESR